MRKRSSTSTRAGMPAMRFCSASPGGATSSIRSKYLRGRICGKISIFIVPYHDDYTSFSLARPTVVRYTSQHSILRAGGSDMPCKPASLDHVNIFVRNADKAYRWYTDILGLHTQ